MDKITILLVDDHKLVRESWAVVINSDPRFKVIGEASNPEEAIMIAKEKKPNIVLMDINMHPVDGFEGTKIMRIASPDSKIIGMSMNAMPEYARQMLQLGAMGYVTKNSSKSELVKAILTISDGEKYVCDEVKVILSTQQLEKNNNEPNLNLLSRRELEIVKLIRDGLSSKEIGLQLDISTKTVEVHRYNILRKLNIKNVAMLVNYINQHGL